jgi:predicted transcriptional regulator
MNPMPTASFTTRIDSELKSELEQIARYEDRSASYIANQAIRNFVEERKATRELVELGLEMVERGAPGIPEEDIEAWLMADEEQPFPKPRSTN